MKPRNSTLLRSHSSIAIAVSVALFTHFTAASAFAVTYYWDNDGITAGFGGAAGTWAAPTTGDATQGWSTSATGELLPGDVTTTTADLVNFGTGANPLTAGTIAVSGTVSTNRVTIPSASGAINLSGGTIALGGTSPSIIAQNQASVIGSAITLGANSSVSYSRATATAGLLTIDGQISGNFNLTFTTPNVNSGGTNQIVVLGSANTYTGNTAITAANINNTTIIRAGVNNALPATTVLTLDGGNGTGSGRTVTYDLNGKNQTLAGLSNNTTRSLRNQRVTSSSAATLTVNNSENYTYGGTDTNGTNTWTAAIMGAITLNKSGAGTLNLAGPNSYTGDTTVSGGKLQGITGANCARSKVIINNAAATLGISITDNTKTWTCGDLAPAAAGTIEFNFGSVTPSDSVSPLTITVPTNPLALTGTADFTAATPTVKVNVDTGLAPGTYPLMTWDTVSGTVPTTADLEVPTMASGTAASLEVIDNTLSLVISSTAATVVKADNVISLNTGSSWVGAVVPTATELAKWNSTVSSANTTVLGADVTWAGITIENPTGPVTINAGNTLTLGAAPVDIDMSAATSDLTLNCQLALGDVNDWNVAATRTLTLGGQVSGAFGLTKLGDGTAVLSSNANSYTGNTTVTAGTLLLGASNVIPHGAGGVAGNVVVNGRLELNGKSDSINGLSGSGVIDNTGATTSTLSVGNNSQTSTFNGAIQSTTGNINLNKTGNGTLTLGGANTFTGTVAIAASTGTLAFSNTAPFDNVTGITIGAGATLRPSVVSAVINAPITLGAVGTTSTITAPNAVLTGTNPVPFDLGGAISGAGNLKLSGVESTNAYGAIDLNAASNYSGSTLITTESLTDNDNANIFVRLFVENALPVTTVVTLDGGDGTGGGRFCELNLVGNDQTLAGLDNVPGLTLRTQRIVSSSAATLTINDSESLRTYSGQINGAISLVKSNVGTWTLSGAKAYTGTTTITGGTLALGSSDVLPATPVSIGGGTLAIAAGFTDTVGTLALTSAATINLGDASSKLVFADSNGETWAGPLSLTGSFVSGLSLRFGTTNAGLSAAQIASISASGFTGFALDDDGFLTATSTGGFSSWITGSFANGTIPADKRGPDDDFDNDGISNLVEYAIAGQDPTVSNASVGSFTAGTLSFTKRDGASGLAYAIEESTDLGLADDWTEVTGGFYVNNATTISYTLTPGTPVKNFTRLRVIAN